MINLQRAQSLVAAFRRQRILVVGDLMLDRYVYGTVERISPEAPVPVVRVDLVREMPGGAANVAVNIRALGGAVVLAGLIGRDAAGAALLRELRRRDVGCRGVLSWPGMHTTVKMRILAERQQVARVDWDATAATGPLAAFCRRVAALARTATGIVIEDYGKGIIRQEVVDAVLSVARRRGIPTGLDPKEGMELRVAGVTLATPNCREAHVCAGLPPRATVAGDPLRDRVLGKAAGVLLRRWRPAHLLITLGAQGMLLVERGRRARHIPTRAREVFDVSGAGDTVIATALLALAAGASGAEAAMLGNCAAGVVVGKLGTATCTPEELLAAVAQT